MSAHPAGPKHAEIPHAPGLSERPASPEELARLAAELNHTGQTIGARRLYTIFEKLLEDSLYEAPETDVTKIYVDKEYVQAKLKGIMEDADLRQFVL